MWLIGVEWRLRCLGPGFLKGGLGGGMGAVWQVPFRGGDGDRKSTRLNSTHPNIFDAVFFFNDTATTEIYTLSLHDALPILFAYLVCSASGAPYKTIPLR